MESTRVIMLRNWHFDILNMEHWEIAWNLWLNSWVISEPKEWAFVLIIISFIPLWLTGWIALSLISWGKMVCFILTLPWKIFKNFFYKPVKIITTNTGVTPIKKKKSYKEIRPKALHPTTPDKHLNSATPISIPTISPSLVTPTLATSKTSRLPKPKPEEPQNFEHTLFKFDDSFDNIDFDIDSFEVENNKKDTKPEKTEHSSHKKEQFDNAFSENRRERTEVHKEKTEESRRPHEDKDYHKDREEVRIERKSNHSSHEDRYQADTPTEAPRQRKEKTVTQRSVSGSCLDIIKQKGYEVVNRINIKNTAIDYIAISKDSICLCMLDREQGDWLADEERFNDEEPLWFSENSHRVSPVRKIDLAKQYLLEKLKEENLNFRVDAYVIVQIGNIINAEDMFEIWDSLNIKVTRIDRGTPREIQLFARTLPDAQKGIQASTLDKVIKTLHNLN